MQLLTVLNIFSRILAVFALLMTFPMGIGFWFDNPIEPFLKSIGITLGLAILVWLLTKEHVAELRARDGLLLATLTWVLLPVFGTMPFMFQIPGLSFTDAYFESMSGLTTTGATVLTHLEQLPQSIHAWRGLLVWVGGMGIIVLTVGILPLLGVGGSQLVKAETPGPMKDSKLTPRITETAKGLWFVYCLLTLLCGLSYYFAGMSEFDALVHACSTMGLGGFSTYDESFAYWNSPLIETLAVVFMLMAGINYATHFQALRSKTFSPYRWDPETRWFLLVVLGAMVLTALYLWGTNVYADLLTAFRYSLFNVVSVATTTGFMTVDYAVAWPLFITFGMLLIAAFATCSGSTGSGIKMMRALVLGKQLRNELIRAVHPNAHVWVKVSGRVVSDRVVFSVLTFLFVYVLCLVGFTFILTATGLEISTAFSATMGCFNNIGPGLNEIGPSSNYSILSDLQLRILTFAMVLGRLEIFTLLTVLTPAFWRK